MGSAQAFQCFDHASPAGVACISCCAQFPGPGAHSHTGESGEASFHLKYRITSRIGKGTFAYVYAAQLEVEAGSEQETLEVAVKVSDLRSKATSSTVKLDANLLRQAEQEAVLLRRVSGQKHCVQYVANYIQDNFSYLVMEKCDYPLLQALERSTYLDEYTLAHVFQQMLHAIASIHSVGVVHRDIKLDNYLHNGDLPLGVVKLCDFGLAESMDATKPQVLETHGTPPFMSPEMLCGRGYAGKTDVWSLGVVAYILFFGRFPYDPLKRTSKAMKEAIISGHPSPSFLLEPPVEGDCSNIAADGAAKAAAVSGGAVDFVRALLARDPDARPSAQRALEEQPWLRGEPPGSGGAEEGASHGARRPAPCLKPAVHAAKLLLVRGECASVRSLHREVTARQRVAGWQSHHAGWPSVLGTTMITSAFAAVGDYAFQLRSASTASWKASSSNSSSGSRGAVAGSVGSLALPPTSAEVAFPCDLYNEGGAPDCEAHCGHVVPGAREGL